MTRELTAATEHAGVRLDAFLSADGALTRSQAARLIAEGRVRVNGKPAAKSARLSGGETVTVDVPQLRETALPPQDIPLAGIRCFLSGICSVMRNCFLNSRTG